MWICHTTCWAVALSCRVRLSRLSHRTWQHSWALMSQERERGIGLVFPKSGHNTCHTVVYISLVRIKRQSLSSMPWLTTLALAVGWILREASANAKSSFFGTQNICTYPGNGSEMPLFAVAPHWICSSGKICLVLWSLKSFTPWSDR